MTNDGRGKWEEGRWGSYISDMAIIWGLIVRKGGREEGSQGKGEKPQ